LYQIISVTVPCRILMTKWNNILPSMMKVAFGFLGFKAYASFGKNEITERIAVLVDFVKLVWNDDMFI